jgi:effector-binding domain-containing protein
MTTVSEPRIDEHAAKPYMGIRTQTPFKGMFAVVDKLRKELDAWFKAQGVEPEGPAFLRYHVIDMAGVLVAAPLSGDERVRAGALPAGCYASLVYSGSGLTGNKALIEWARVNGVAWDRCIFR